MKKLVIHAVSSGVIGPLDHADRVARGVKDHQRAAGRPRDRAHFAQGRRGAPRSHGDQNLPTGRGDFYRRVVAVGSIFLGDAEQFKLAAVEPERGHAFDRRGKAIDDRFAARAKPRSRRVGAIRPIQ